MVFSFSSNMILKIVLFLTIISIVAGCKGGQCFSETDLINYNRIRHHDLSTYTKYSIDHFDIVNRQCMLTALVYTNKKMFMPNDINQQDLSVNLSHLFTLVIKLYRVLNVEIKMQLGKDDLWTFYKYVRGDLTPGMSPTMVESKMESIVNVTNKIITAGALKDLWYTEKETEIYEEYIKPNDTRELTLKAFRFCINALNTITEPSKDLDTPIVENYFDAQTKPQFNNHTPTAIAFGQVLLLMNKTKYDVFKLQNTKRKENILIVEIQKYFLSIFESINGVLAQIEYLPCCKPEASNLFEYDTSLHLELLIMLKQIYTQTIEAAQDYYLLINLKKRALEDKFKQFYQEYRTFIKQFQSKWTKLFPELRSVLEGEQEEEGVLLAQNSGIRNSPNRLQSDSADWGSRNVSPQPSNAEHRLTGNASPQPLFKNPRNVKFDEKNITNTTGKNTAAGSFSNGSRLNSRLQSTRSFSNSTNGSSPLQEGNTLSKVDSYSSRYLSARLSSQGADESSNLQENILEDEQPIAFVKNGTVSPSVYLYTAKSYTSWNDTVLNDNEVHHLKKCLIEVATWISILRYNVNYSAMDNRKDIDDRHVQRLLSNREWNTFKNDKEYMIKFIEFGKSD